MKKYLYVVPLVLLFCFTIACQNKAEKAELEKFRAQAKLEEQNKELVRSFIAALDKNDFSRLKELVSDDSSFEAPALAEPLGSEQSISLAKAHYSSFPDWEHKLENIVAEDDIVMVKLNQNGTHKAEYDGIPATDKKVTMPGVYFFVISSGKVKKFWAIEDFLGFMQQLGMELKPIAAKK
jgi:steroid delta-isomerase-like uncharacterized protein